MASVRVVVVSPVGLHARPAAAFVQAVVASGIPVTISKIHNSDGERPALVDARSILGVLALDVRHGETVELRADGPAAGELLGVLAAMLGS
jgi:phosphocarrier protein